MTDGTGGVDALGEVTGDWTGGITLGSAGGTLGSAADTLGGVAGSRCFGFGQCLLSRSAICWIAVVVESPACSDGIVDGGGSLRIARMSLSDWRRKSSVETVGKGIL